MPKESPNNNGWLYWAVVLTVVLCAIPAAFWYSTFSPSSLSGEPAHWSAFGDFFGGVISPILTFGSFLGLLITIKKQQDNETDRKIKDDDQQYFAHSIACMQRAFDAISDGGKSSRPIQSRLAWLTCARLLISAKRAGERISNQSKGLQEMLKGEEEHWRREFYEFFQLHKPGSVGTSLDYFRGNAERYGEVIEERSIRVIYEFMAWPDDIDDPIDTIKLYERAELDRMEFGMLGIKAYILSSNRFKQDRLED